jgi:universal stress protein E
MKLLCATDLLPKSDAAIERAGLLATELRADLSLLHVVAPIASEHVLEQELQLAIAQLESRSRPPLWVHGSVPKVLIRTGAPARMIVEAVEEERPALLVLGPHRKRGLRDALEGTLASKVLTSRKSPVLIVRREPRGMYRKVLLAVDLSEVSAAAVRAADALVLGGSAEVNVLHAFEPPHPGTLRYAGAVVGSSSTYANAWKREATTALRDLLKYETRDFARYGIHVEEGRPARAILRAVQASEPDVLVIGTRAAGRVHRALAGSVASEVLEQVTCDVLVVPSGCFISETRGAEFPARRRAPVSARDTRSLT